ncbi:MAG: hypothetical protein K0R93_3525 [Anaerosolibacter sp.]|jgi:hypothetical protein|uniref:YkuS family protein n=1 Tax=Anaerosolibacter sp. TaxID=1872527 RepID=UPI00262A9131|nr:YkuS family protein [Anaerosolibacter sp.]MDF2548627.1 hypothetical protein [Anaerosolibacter sp.]
MPKVIAIPPGLEAVGRQLEARGYEVVDERYEGYVDTILYDSNYSRLSYLTNFDNVIDMDRGAFVVNAGGKNVDEIIYAIERRSYESLF